MVGEFTMDYNLHTISIASQRTPPPMQGRSMLKYHTQNSPGSLFTDARAVRMHSLLFLSYAAVDSSSIEVHATRWFIYSDVERGEPVQTPS